MSPGQLGLLLHAVAGGAQVRWVMPDSAADEAGIRPGMVITQVDGAPIAGLDDPTRDARFAGEVGTVHTLSNDSGVTFPVTLKPRRPPPLHPIGAPDRALHDQVIRWNPHRRTVIVAWLDPNQDEGRALAAQLRSLVKSSSGQLGAEVRLLGRWDLPAEYAHTRAYACAAQAGADPDAILAAIATDKPAPGTAAPACLAAPVDRADTDVAIAMGVGNAPWTWVATWLPGNDPDAILAAVARRSARPSLPSRCVLAMIGRAADDAELGVLTAGHLKERQPIEGGERWSFYGGFSLYVSDHVSAAGFVREGPAPFVGELPFGIFANDPDAALDLRLTRTASGWMKEDTFIDVATWQEADHAGEELRFTRPPVRVASPPTCPFEVSRKRRTVQP